jgi:hypothetical protein
MFTRLTAAAALVLIGFTGAALAQTDSPNVAREAVAPTEPTMHEHFRSDRHQVAITDEYGFKYDSRGDRLDANGYIIPPPRTLPGARVIQNGPGYQ